MIAPMMGYTDRHYRYFIRQISKKVRLYTEMVTTGAILYGPRERLLQYDPIEHPIALQLGGSEPKALAECAKIAMDYGYDEVNLNVGCPSDRVQSGRFGACLMKEPELVAECVVAMQQAVKIPVTVKTRIGVDEYDSYQFLASFIEKVSQSGCQSFILHARKAWLKGLSPKENREIPPLHYKTVWQIKRDFPALKIAINGGITKLEQIKQHLEQCDGVMIGREAYHNSYLLALVDQMFYDGQSPVPSREEILRHFLPYLERQSVNNKSIAHIVRHILGLFHGMPGGRLWRRILSEPSNASIKIKALKAVINGDLSFP